MAFTNNPALPRDRVRMKIGDIDQTNEYLSDQWYDYFIQQNSKNETLAALDAAKAILSYFTKNSREKVDQVEVWGNDQFDNYLKWLKEFTENPSISGLKSAIPFGGGTSKSDMNERKSDSDNNLSPLSVGDNSSVNSDKYISGYWRFV